ncbi:MAG: DNA alkylation repair protein [Ferruginibacter sp.]
MKKETPAAKSVDEYLEIFPVAVQNILEKVRQTIKTAAPKAEEVISYQMPAYKYHGMLVYFAGWKNHIGFYPTSSGTNAFKKELSVYKGAKGSVQFPIGKPIPLGLISKIVKFRVKENEAKAAAKKNIMPGIKIKKIITPLPAKEKKTVLQKELTAKQFIERLKALQSDEELKKIQRYFKSEKGDYGYGDKFMGIKMGNLFAVAKEFREMPIAEIEKLLENPIHEVRAGAVSIMDKASRNKKITESRLKEFYELYMRRHDRINNWDLVDLGCLYMTGSYLFDKPRTILYKLARSKNLWERRTAILSTCYFLRKGEIADTFKIAEILVDDKEDLVHKATGWMLRFAGDKNQKELLKFLDKYAATMPRTLLRYSIEKFDKKKKEYYMGMKKV